MWLRAMLGGSNHRNDSVGVSPPNNYSVLQRGNGNMETVEVQALYNGYWHTQSRWPVHSIQETLRMLQANQPGISFRAVNNSGGIVGYQP